ncbi:MAG: hypothetical protein ACFE85_11120 [Candidatus Hodarchaeota archaeon]
MNNTFCIKSQDVLKTALKLSNKKKEDFQVAPFIIIYFSNFLIKYLEKELKLKKDEWLLPYHPYASGFVFNGNYEGIPISVIQPPMGASPLSCVIEDLIYCGAKVLLLVCGSWGIGKKVELLDYIIPTHTSGPDGTSVYYSREIDEEIEIDHEIFNIIQRETKKRTSKIHFGKNYSIEAFYQLNKTQILKLQQLDFISIENGELNVITSICRLRGTRFGAIFYSYFNPLVGWNVPWFNDDYRMCVELQGEIALATIKEINSKKKIV